MLAITYIQVISAIWRDSIGNEQPRIIAIDEVYRLMQYPALLPFLIKAAKTLRTRRKKLILIDQTMDVFLQGDARHIFENCPIRVIFHQQSIDVFYNSAFQHFTDTHRVMIGSLPQGWYVFDVKGQGVWAVFNQASESEIRRFGNT